MNHQLFTDAYKKLNMAQKEAVDSIDGPVMVVAGPGTGKTQVLSLRIANILLKTDTPPDGILCLTFTNSGVRAMQERLASYIGAAASSIRISTFHSFAMNIVEEFYPVLDVDSPPVIMDDAEAVSLVDEILEEGTWQYLRPRGDSGKYFRDLKSLISLLKREALSPDDFLLNINQDIERITNDPDSISTRGESKGMLKKEIEKQIQGLLRTKEIVRFYEEYEKLKQERLLADYDDVLRYAFQIVSESETARATLQERYLYILVDEHQDSSALQNDLLKAIWHSVELPNIFVVGDDRQLIYGFGGARVEYFEGFKTLFGKAQLITLVENYRSTQTILDGADTLLSSTLTLEKLKSNHPEIHQLRLVECSYPRDEILAAAHAIEEKIEVGMRPEDCAILVPKNYQVKNAVQILRDRGIPVAAGGILTLFECPETETIIRILKVVQDPYDKVSLGAMVFDPVFGIPALDAHRFLRAVDPRKLSLDDFSRTAPNILGGLDPISNLGLKLKTYINENSTRDVYETIQCIGEEILLDRAVDHDELIKRVEVVRTLLHLTLLVREKCERQKIPFTVNSFLDFINRLRDYGEDIPLAVFYGAGGVRVMTLHASKGLEFDFVWVAHMDEKTVASGKRNAFVLPESVSSKIEEKDELVVRRQIYVALTRAKRFCTFSYARFGYNGGEQQLANVLRSLPENIFDQVSHIETEAVLLHKDPKAYVVNEATDALPATKEELAQLVKEEYAKTKVSVTMLNNFFECPWKWYFRNLLRLPDVLSESLIFGNVVHGTIEQVLKNSSVIVSDAILAEIHKQGVYDTVRVNRFKREAEEIVGNWTATRLPTLEKNRISERSVSYRDNAFPHLSFYGKIDLTEMLPDGTLRVTDFKTGSVKTKNEIEKQSDDGRLGNYMRQLAMYSFLIQGAKKSDRVSESQLEFLEAKKGDKNMLYSARITNEEIDLLVRDITEYDTSLRTGEWINRPCDFKSYGTNSECPDCARAGKVYRAS